ncbi:MAG TPA: serine/threonine-protein kinase [Gaiellaceae bacterium]|nr:serine/threonine-protein kinase [Gaiellaceae bacterium]
MTVGGGTLPGRYEEPRLVGRGGMGEIYVARDRVLGRTVAVKLLAERLAQEPELRERFRREALAAARLSGEPHVVTVYDVGEHDGRPFTVMEYLPGGTLAERAQSRPVDARTALAWLAQAAAALDAAHAKGVVHRDVKPANLIFDATDRLQVVDFGIARVTDDTLGMTAPGTILGTAGYLAPEQALGRETTAASDRYALAVVAYELLTGGRPFARGSETAEASAHVHDPVPPASGRAPWLPPQVDAVFARGLAKGPEHRHPSAGAFVAALGEALSEEPAAPPPARPRPRRRTSPLLAAALAGGVLFAAAGLAAAFLAAGDGEKTAGDRPDRETVTRRVTVEEGPATVVQTVTEPAAAPASGPRESLTPEEAAELNDEAFALMQQGNWEDALPLLEQAVPALRRTYSAGFPYEAYAEYNLGRTLEALGDCPQARRHLRRSARLQGEREEITAALERCA